MYTRKLRGYVVALAFALTSSAAFAQAPNLGKPINPAEIAAWDNGLRLHSPRNAMAAAEVAQQR